MKKIAFFLILIFGCAIQAQTSIQKSIKTFEKAFQNKNYAEMKDLLAPQFTVGVGDSSSNEFYLNSIFKAFPALDSIQIGKSAVLKNETFVLVDFCFNGKEKSRLKLFSILKIKCCM